MVNFVAPLVILLASSFVFYKKHTLWRLEEYKLSVRNWNWEVAEDFVDLKNAVLKGQIDASDAQHIINKKWPEGERGRKGISNAEAQEMVDKAVRHKTAQVV